MVEANALFSITGLSIELLVPEDVSTNDTSFTEYLDSLSTLNRINFTEGEFFFSDVFWDFSPYVTTNISKNKLKLDFGTIPSSFDKLVKYFMISQLIKKKRKIQTLYEYLKIYKNFFIFIDSQSYFDIEDISIDLIQEFLDDSNFSLKRRSLVLHAIRLFLLFYDQYYVSFLTKSLTDFLDPQWKHHRFSLKTPDIPSEYFNTLNNCCIQIINSSHADDKPYQGISAILILLGQTGLRIGELLALYVDCKKKISAPDGSNIKYLAYYTWKREKGNNKKTLVNTLLTQPAEYAILFLEKLYLQKRNEIGSKYLFQYNNRNTPTTPHEFNIIVKSFYLYIDKYMPTLNLPSTKYPELSRTKISSFKGFSKKHIDDFIVHPSSPQYRVHTCTELSKQDLHEDYIMKFYGHLSSGMSDYYNRPKKATPQENMDSSFETLKQLVNDEIEPLGGDNSLIERINKFISSNNYKIAHDNSEIYNLLSELQPIAVKPGGACTKSFKFRGCGDDAPTNDFLTTDTLCPNTYHFYTMLPDTYKQAQILETNINRNLSNSFIRQAEKETNMLYTLASSRLTTEMNSLKKYINKLGTASILEKNPDLLFFIENFENIMGEIEHWKLI